MTKAPASAGVIFLSAAKIFLPTKYAIGTPRIPRGGNLEDKTGFEPQRIQGLRGQVGYKLTYVSVQ